MEPTTGPANEVGVPLAGIVFEAGDPINQLLLRVAEALAADGVSVAGVVQARVNDPATGRSNLVLRGLRDGWELPILEERGQQAKGCRLDSRAITDVAGRLERELAPGAGFLIVNRFGRAEAEGQGLRHLLARAASEGIPVIAGVRQDYAAAWAAFHGGLGVALPPDPERVLAWCRRAAAGAGAPERQRHGMSAPAFGSDQAPGGRRAP
ncbi:hypothetical protein N177_4077 [Lutibaculum baratangense AMV1]|uniref:DUF2478 domain-containing protein n=2 Tax=Lutibaculum TaxID=1358438 RepID=V4QRY6_9HYPH|nr:hypothetical protein N177_4077 [Lutibaculum baratangense AMV1]